jgi:SAM-dependent methyltransferase
MGVFPHGKTRVYADQDLQRLLYNLAYLRSMWRWVPPAEGRAVLEVGCSDGLTCDLLANEGPAAMVGIDYWAGEGFTFRDPQVVYAQGDGHCLSFADQTFDLVYSIATLEHCRNPFAVLQEIQRVTRPGGYGYVQAGPLYYSPFGHHMFGFFDHYPWIHLRLSRDEIVAYCERTGIAREIERVRGTSAGEYIDSMLNAHHVNGKRLEEYGLQEFANSPGVEVIHFAPSYEGQDLLSPEIAAELGHLAPSDLIAHGFELVFRKVV